MTERSLPAGHGIVASPGDGARSHPRIEALLGRYPALSAGELQELLEWFAREASADDVAVIASNEAIRDGYLRFRAEHVDALTLKDLARAALFVALAAAALIGVFWLAS